MLLFASMLWWLCVQSQNDVPVMKQEEIIEHDILNELKNEINALKQRINTLENIVENVDPQCLKATDKQSKYYNFADISSQCTHQWEQYKIAAQVNDNKLQIYLHDAITKRIYWNEFTSTELQKCGFSNIQASNLEKISKFILNVINEKPDDIQFDILHKDDVSLINFIKKDSYFGAHLISLELQSVPRKTVNILMDHIIDLQNENENIKQSINELTDTFSNTINDEIENVKNEFKNELSSMMQTVVDNIDGLRTDTNNEILETKNAIIDEQKIEEINLKLINNWSNYAGGYAEPKAYRKGRIVYLKGLIKGGTIGTVMSVLPEGWRPDKRRIFCQNQSGTSARVDVTAGGEIVVIIGAHVSSWVPLDGIVFVM